MKYGLIVSLILSLFVSLAARAELGGTPLSPNQAQLFFHGTRRLAKTSKYFSVNEVHYGGTFVREYIGNDGKVFALAWEGLSHPDFSHFLGSYYAAFKLANIVNPENARAQGNRNYVLNAGSMTLEKGGHMGHVMGRAYDAQLFPLNFTKENIK